MIDESDCVWLIDLDTVHPIDGSLKEWGVFGTRLLLLVLVRVEGRLRNFVVLAGYMAPEQRSRHTPSLSGDVYSFGVLIVAVCTGQPAREAWGLLPNSPHYQPLPVIRHEGLLEIVVKCMDRNPSLRPRIGEVVNALSELRFDHVGECRDDTKLCSQ